MNPTAAGAAPIQGEVSSLGLSGWTLWRVFFRSLFLQASWNPQGMQNLGLAYAVFPALQKLYPDPQKLSEALARHLAFFNTHPYVGAAIVGGVLHHEAKIARGEEPPATVDNFKAALMGPLAALGDGFFWLSLRPAVGAVAAALVPLFHAGSTRVSGRWVPWLHAGAPLLFLLLYNVVHLTLRAKLFRLGLRRGDGLVEELGRQNLPARGARLRAVAAASAGGLAAWLALEFGLHEGGRLAPVLAGGCLALGVVSYGVVRRQVTGYAALYLAALLAIVAGASL
jgi:mannose PTS system EIID component